MTRRTLITCCFAAAVLLQHAIAQTLGSTNTAPESSRFPTAWYPTGDAVPGIPVPVTGKPYTAVQVTVGAMKAADGTLHPVTLRGDMMRDSEGRARTEQPRPRTGADGIAHEVHLVDVEDPVAHCHFSWEEPWVLAGQPKALVQCSGRTVRYVSTPLSHMTDMTDGESARGSEVVTTSHLPAMEINGVQALGVRFAHATPQPDGSRQAGLITEMWYSPDLMEIVRLHNTFAAASGMPPHNLDLEDVKRTEPPAEVFYPPAGYDMVSTSGAPRGR